MKVVFMGTPDFSVPTLQALVDAGYEVAGVFTQPDRPRGRGGKVQMSPVKELALRLGMTENNVAVRLSRLREKLRKYLLEKGVLE